ncbi:MAG: glycosyltransferase [Syntrophorhabdaceae bacterium]|nr:glycosyltransferase [Syntrophorhabdaceae bacterium]
MNPKVSIIIPVYNGADYMREAIDSALAQTYPNCEVIVVNDGSNDDGKTDTIAREYGDKITYFTKPNGGVASALNVGIQKMKGEYFSWLSHDDVYHENKIELQMRHLQQYSEPIIMYSDFEMIDANSRPCGVTRLPEVPASQFIYYITVSAQVHGCTLLVPRVCFEKYGLFDETLKTTQDYDMWFRLAANYEVHHIHDVLVKSRSHAGQGSHSMKQIAMKEVDNLRAKQLLSLSEEVITGATGVGPCISYAYMAKIFGLRGMPGAMSIALELSEQKKDNLSVVQRLRLLFLTGIEIPAARLIYFLWIHVLYPFRLLRMRQHEKT